jgi:GGDEF domain-containing protein
VLVVIIVTIITLAVSAKKKKALIFEKLAYTDPVTGGWNQTKFYKETDKIKFNDGKYAVGYINIENFKYINDFYGREQGDIVLKFMNRIHSHPNLNYRYWNFPNLHIHFLH